MSIKKWKEYLKVNEETTPVSATNTVEQELTTRSTDLENIKLQVNEITAAATSLAAMTEIDAVNKAVEDKINAYSNNKDSFVTLALSYLKTIGDKKNIELKLLKYKTEIPALQAEIKTKLDELNAEIEETRSLATQPPSK